MSNIFDQYKLLRVYYGDDEGVVSLTLRRVLFYVSEMAAATEVFVAPEIPAVNFPDILATRLLGDEHNWNDVVDFMATNYDWDRKLLVEPPCYIVNVGNIGNVYNGLDKNEAYVLFRIYKDQSVHGYGRAAGEQVGMYYGDRVIHEHVPS